MIKYWKFTDKVEAKVTTNKDGALVMKMAGEDEEFPGFPRGYLLFGKLSKLKHEIKNQIFNESWRKLEGGIPEAEIIESLRKTVSQNIFSIAEETKYDMVPYERMFLPVKEIYRAWTKAAPGENSLKWRDILTFIIQEDDGYRFRLQFLAEYVKPWRWIDPVKQFDRALTMVELGEVIGDMKEKQKLLHRVLLMVLRNKGIREKFDAFVKEVDWSKVKLSTADKYHFRGKYFKVDLELFDY